MSCDLYSVVGERRYLHYDNWLRHRWEWGWQHPLPTGCFRVDLELCRAPIPEHTLYYACNEWRVRLALGEHSHPDGSDCWRLLVDDAPEAGEEIILWSNFSLIWPEPWGRNKPIVTACWRGERWLVSWCEFLADHWRGYTPYPLRSQYREYKQPARYHPDNYTSEYFKQPRYLREPRLPLWWLRYAITGLTSAGRGKGIHLRPLCRAALQALSEWLAECGYRSLPVPDQEFCLIDAQFQLLEELGISREMHSASQVHLIINTVLAAPRRIFLPHQLPDLELVGPLLQEAQSQIDFPCYRDSNSLIVRRKCDWWDVYRLGLLNGLLTMQLYDARGLKLWGYELEYPDSIDQLLEQLLATVQQGDDHAV